MIGEHKKVFTAGDVTSFRPATVKTVKPCLAEKLIEKMKVYGTNALKAGKYAQAISSFYSLVDHTDDWSCRYLLGVAYMRANIPTSARHQFVYIAERCPDTNLRRKALEELILLTRVA